MVRFLVTVGAGGGVGKEEVEILAEGFSSELRKRVVTAVGPGDSRRDRNLISREME